MKFPRRVAFVAAGRGFVFGGYPSLHERVCGTKPVQKESLFKEPWRILPILVSKPEKQVP